MDDSHLQIRDLGEQELLRRLQQFCPAEFVGDDAAIAPLCSQSHDPALVVTTDLLIDGVHFSLGRAIPQVTTPPVAAGWRAAAANLSDLAAMGATPVGITVGLGLPGDLPVSWIEQLYEGITACLKQHQTVILGGDICRAPVLTIAITALGKVHPDQAIRRNAARPGDAIVVTGYHGNSRAGLELLLHPEQGQALSAGERSHLIQAHQYPQPRLDVLPGLWEVLGSQATPVAGMDSSDGLADAILQICRASGTGAQVTQLPTDPVLYRWVERSQALDWTLYGGEDFELVLTLPQQEAQALVQRLGSTAMIVGEINESSAVELIDLREGDRSIQLTLDQGFQHFGTQV